MLEISGLHAGYGEIEVLRGVDLVVNAGEIVALIGANGAGKTTLAKTLAGLLPTRYGRIWLAGKLIERAGAPQRIALGMAHVPEGRQIVAGLSVGDNLRLGAYAQRRYLAKREMAQRVRSVCQQFPALVGRLGEPAGNLSGGQQQMLAIARAMMAQPRLLILDEPSLGLAPTLVSGIFHMIVGLRDQGIAILLSEQNARMSLAIADRAYVMEMGRVTLQGTGKELLNSSEVAERYLGVGQKIAASATDERRRRLVRGLKEILHD
jgi:branched-chain amino acid transport system ATP-binding protein